jgi:uncharacterized membrane protein
MGDFGGLLICVGVLFWILPLVVAAMAMGAVGRLRREVGFLRREVGMLRQPVVVEKPAASAAVARGPGTVAAPAAPAAPVEPTVQKEAAADTGVIEERAAEAPGKRAAAFARLTKAPPVVARGKAAVAAAAAPAETAGAGAEAPPDAPPAEVRAAPPSPRPTKPALSLEQWLIRMGVWVGGLAFALAGIFLVKVAFEHNILSPAVRVGIGTAFGLALRGAGVWRQKKEAGVAQALSAAGIADLFACFLAATNLYHLLSPTTGFALLAATTAAAVVLSLKQGPFVALLGLVGGFLTPALIRTDHPSAASLFGYLLLLQVGLIGVTRVRRWWWLAALTVLASQGWVALWLITQPWSASDGPALGMFVLMSTVVVTLSAMQEEGWDRNPLWARLLTYGTLVSGMGLSGVLLAVSGFSAMEWGFIGLLSAGCMVLARVRWAYEPLAWLAAVLVFGLLWWDTQHGMAEHQLRAEAAVAAFGGLFALGAYGLMWGSKNPAAWANLSGVAALAFTLLAYFGLGVAPRGVSWAHLPEGVAVLYAGLSVPVMFRRKVMRMGEEVFSALATCAVAALALAPPMAWEQAQLTAGWAVLVPLTAWLAVKLRVGSLKTMTGVLAGLVAVRLAANPMVFSYGAGASFWWNPLVWAYVPGMAGLLGAMFILERGEKRAEHKEKAQEFAGWLQVAASVVGLAFVTMMTRRFFHGESLSELSLQMVERSTYPSVWVIAGMGLLAIGWKWGPPAQRAVGYATVGVAMGYVLLVQVLVANPLWWGDALGPRVVVNWLLYMYGLPAAMIGGAAWWMGRRREGTAAVFAPIAGAVSLLLVFVLVTLEIRHAFHGPVLARAEVDPFGTLAERGTYAVMWLAAGIGLVAAGRRAESTVLAMGGYAFAWAGLAFALGFESLFLNPLALPTDVGDTKVFNWLLYGYGAPAVLLGGIAVWLFEAKDATARGMARAAAVASLVLLFVLVTLEVRQGFQGTRLVYVERPGSAEMYAYSAAWAVLGTVLLVAGIVTRGPILRWASLGVMLLAILKVFLFDTAHLSDIFRVLSFAGLGVSLTLLGLLYHYFVFRRPVVETAGGAVAEGAAGQGAGTA